MHLVYVDDSGSDENNPIVLCGGLIIHDRHFHRIESIHGAIVEQVLPADVRHRFQEFHAVDLYNGSDAFEGVREDLRFNAIRVLLNTVRLENLRFVYAAVDKHSLQSYPLLGSADPVDVAFRQCVSGVDKWATALWTQDPKALAPPTKHDIKTHEHTCIYILDDTSDMRLKKLLRRSYRALRPKQHDLVNLVASGAAPLFHAHDDMYFGDSRESVGIQISDLCGYFMLRQLKGVPDTHGFYGSFAPQVVCSKPTDHMAAIFKCHETASVLP